MKTYTIGMKNKIETRDVNFWYGDFHALKGISMDIEEKSVIAFIGPSGCGKSTFLRLLNRMNDLIPDTRLTGEIRIELYFTSDWTSEPGAEGWQKPGKIETIVNADLTDDC